MMIWKENLKKMPKNSGRVWNRFENILPLLVTPKVYNINYELLGKYVYP